MASEEQKAENHNPAVANPSGYLLNMSASCILSEKGWSVHEQEQRMSYLNP